MDAGMDTFGELSGYSQKWMEDSIKAKLGQLEQQNDTPSCNSVGVTLLAPTAQQPKAPLQDSPQADQEGIRNAWSPAAVVGIRSLPNAMAPDYRQQLFMQLLLREKQRQVQLHQQRLQSHSAASTSDRHQRAANSPQSSKEADARSDSAPASPAGKMPHRYSPLQGYFSTYDHITSEYDRKALIDKFARLNSRMAEVATDTFVVRGCPLPQPHTPAFAEFTYSSRPFEEVDYMGRPAADQRQQQPPAHGAFIPAGRSCSPDVTLRGRAGELVGLLDKQMAKDWPKSFLKVFYDHEGALVVSFDATAAVKEGDLAVYMNHQAKQGRLITDFRLVKDPQRWGIVEDAGSSVFYILVPPWCTIRPELPDELQGRLHDERPDSSQMHASACNPKRKGVRVSSPQARQRGSC